MQDLRSFLLYFLFGTLSAELRWDKFTVALTKLASARFQGRYGGVGSPVPPNRKKAGREES